MNKIVIAKKPDETEKILPLESVTTVIRDAAGMAKKQYKQQWRRDRFVSDALAGYCAAHGYESLRVAQMDGITIDWIVVKK